MVTRYSNGRRTDERKFELAGRLILSPFPFLLSWVINRFFVNGHELRESCFRQNVYSPTRCLFVKLAINVKLYLSVSRFKTGYALTIILPSSYHIRIGSGFSTMQLAELALYSNGARFLRNSLSELFSLSLSLTASAISSFLVSLMCAVSVYPCTGATAKLPLMPSVPE
jgi:hypothetical protein